MSTVPTIQSSTPETKPRVTKGSIWIDEHYDHTLYIHVAKEDDPHGYVCGPTLAISKQDSTLIETRANSALSASAARRIYPDLQPLDINEELLDALADIHCPDCDHSLRQHADEYGCEQELGDKWVSGNNCDGLVAQGPCHCKCEDRPDLQVAIKLIRKAKALKAVQS